MNAPGEVYDLHIGTCKAGSTSIQRFLCKLRGVLFPAICRTRRKPVHTEFVDTLKALFKNLRYRLHIIIYLRDKASYVNSRHVQNVKRFMFTDRGETVLLRPGNGYDFRRHFQPLIDLRKG